MTKRQLTKLSTTTANGSLPHHSRIALNQKPTTNLTKGPSPSVFGTSDDNISGSGRSSADFRRKNVRPPVPLDRHVSADRRQPERHRKSKMMVTLEFFFGIFSFGQFFKRKDFFTWVETLLDGKRVFKPNLSMLSLFCPRHSFFSFTTHS